MQGLRRTTAWMYGRRGLARVSDGVRRAAGRLGWELDVDDFDGDLRVRLRLDDHIGSQIFWRGHYSGPQLGVLDGLLSPTHVFLDVGANQGEFTLFAAKRVPRGRVVAYEPVASVAARLRGNVRANGFGHVSIREVAVGAAAGTAALYHPTQKFDDGTGHDGLASLYPSARCSSQGGAEVPMVTLDAEIDRLALQRVDVLKIDIEGAELEALRGARVLLREHKPAVIIELNASTARAAGYRLDDLVAELAAHGYRLFVIEGTRQRPRLRPLRPQELSDFQNVLCL